MNRQLASAGIVARMKDYFERQLAWFEVMRDEIAEVETGIDPDQIEHLLETDSARVQSSKDLEREFLALKSEWDRTDAIPDREVEDVKVLAREAERLANELQQSIERAAEQAMRGQAQMSQAVSADAVSDVVFDAIRDGKLYIFTDDGPRDFARGRLEAILSRS